MPDQITSQPNVKTESKFEKYAPLLKSVAAIGLGVFGDSAASRGIATGLANSAQNDIQVRDLLAEETRKKNLADIKARQGKLKMQADLLWKTSQAMESVEARNRFLESQGYEDIVSEMTGVNFELPESFAKDATPGIDIDFKPFKAEIDAIEDDGQKAMAMAYYNIAVNAAGENKDEQVSLNLKRMRETIDGPAQIPVWNDDGSAYIMAGSLAEAVEKSGGEFARKSKPKAEEPKVNPKTEKSYEDFDRASKDYRNSLTLEAYEDVPAPVAFKTLHKIGTDLLAFNDFDIQSVDAVESPYPGWVDGLYEIVAFTGLFTELVDNDTFTGDPQSEGDVWKFVINSSVQAEIKRRAGLLSGAEDKTPKQSQKQDTGPAPPSGKVKPVDQDQLDWINEQKALPAAQRDTAYPGALKDLQSRYPELKI